MMRENVTRRVTQSLVSNCLHRESVAAVMACDESSACTVVAVAIKLVDR